MVIGRGAALFGILGEHQLFLVNVTSKLHRTLRFPATYSSC
jgi:hypothetical protein